MRVLLDTCALADLRDPSGHPAVKAAIALLSDDDLYLSGLTLGEITRGVLSLPDGRKKRNLRSWLTSLKRQYADRILAVDAETAELWGEINVRVQRAGHVLNVVEGLLAATALCSGLHVMTRSTPRFAATGVLIVDPYTGFDTLPKA